LNLSERNNIGVDITDERVTGEFISLFDKAEYVFNNEKYLNLPAWGYIVLCR
jgi:hypothetical protein